MQYSGSMRRAVLAQVLLLLVLAPAVTIAQTPAADQSLDRMRAVLSNKPLRLDVAEPEATFKVEIKAIHPMHEIFDKPPWQLDPIGWQPPALGLDLSFIFRYMAAVKRSHDERVARDEVQRAIADYCAVQPNASTIQICANLSAR
jgi:hypothetical protein